MNLNNTNYGQNKRNDNNNGYSKYETNGSIKNSICCLRCMDLK